MNVSALRLLVLVFVAASAVAQAAPSTVPMAFDVASVRPSGKGVAQQSNVPLDAGYVYGTMTPEDSRTAAGGHLIATHQALWRYISFAYKLSGTQELSLRFNMFSSAPKSGAPVWVTGSFDGAPEFFDISARAAGETTIDQMRVMMQGLLAERFKLAVHFVSADAPVFGLVVAKADVTGPNLRLHPAADVCANAKPDAGSPVGELPPVCGVISHVPAADQAQHFGGRAVPLALLATTVPTMTGLAAMPRPVVDQTGLAGLYDFTMAWMHDASGDEAIGENAGNFRRALKEQLGLELKSSHAPISFLIVDHVEKPSEN